MTEKYFVEYIDSELGKVSDIWSLKCLNYEKKLGEVTIISCEKFEDLEK